jgi:hypothetical protein
MTKNQARQNKGRDNQSRKRRRAPVRASLRPLAKAGWTAPITRVPGLGFPHAMVSQLRYCDTLTMTSTAGSFAKYVFRWNSTFDPDLTGTGHQPLFRDTYASLYDQYAVTDAWFEVQFINNTISPFLVGCVNEDSSNTPSTVNAVMEQAEGQHRLLPPQSGSLSSVTFNSSWNCEDKLRIDPYASQTYKTAVGSNPSEESDVVVWCATPDVSTAVLYFTVTLVQRVLWTELVTPTQS